MKYLDLLRKIKVFESLAMEIEQENSQVMNYIEVYTENFILKKLKEDDRLSFYELVQEDKIDDAINYIQKKIPNFYNELSVGISLDLEKLIKHHDQ